MGELLSIFYSDDEKRKATVYLKDEPFVHYEARLQEGKYITVKMCSSQVEAEELAEDWVI